MSTLPQHRDAIKAMLQAVAGIGVVNDYERYAKGPSKFQQFFVSGGRVNGWLIRRVATSETSPSLGRYSEIHRWEIRGYMTLDDADASEKIFDGLIEAIRDAFRANETMGIADLTTIMEEGEAGIQVVDSGPVMLGGVLCHGCRLRLSTWQHF